LIVNPIAGIGGRVALKGSDGSAVQREAFRRGARPVAHDRAVLALEALIGVGGAVELVTYPSPMGESAAAASGLTATVAGAVGEVTGPDDTRRAAQELVGRGVDLLVFVGGDGTAVDVMEAVGARVPVIGVPAGVKMHSAVFSVSPRSAGRLAAAYARDPKMGLRTAEVMDVDEDSLRAGIVSPRLRGYLRVPEQPRLMQSAKARSPIGEQAAVGAIAGDVVSRMDPDCTYLFGPGTTTSSIMRELGLDGTLLGVDAVRGGKVVASDATETDLVALAARGNASIVVSPIGGQGFLFGRGNQQISPPVIRQVGRDGIIVVATEEKVAALAGSPFRIDTGDPDLDDELRGYVRVITGYRQEIVYRVEP
jgi:predicted polyphosphate/ATP-dependent NAD kinase